MTFPNFNFLKNVMIWKSLFPFSIFVYFPAYELDLEKLNL